MGPITILVRRPSLRLPVARSDLEEEVGSVQSVGRVSAYYSESEFGSAPQGDPPHWAIQGLSQHLRKTYKLTLFNFDLIQPDSSQDYSEFFKPLFDKKKILMHWSRKDQSRCLIEARILLASFPCIHCKQFSMAMHDSET